MCVCAHTYTHIYIHPHIYIHTYICWTWLWLPSPKETFFQIKRSQVFFAKSLSMFALKTLNKKRWWGRWKKVKIACEQCIFYAQLAMHGGWTHTSISTWPQLHRTQLHSCYIGDNAISLLRFCPGFGGHRAPNTGVEPTVCMGRHPWGLRFLMLGTLFHRHKSQALSWCRLNVTSSKRLYLTTHPTAPHFSPLPFPFHSLFFFAVYHYHIY